MKVLVLANCNYPTLTSMEDLERILYEVEEIDKLILLGDFLDVPRKDINMFMLSIEKDLHKIFNKFSKAGCREIVYIVGDIDQPVMMLHTKILHRVFGSRCHISRICEYHVMNIRGNMCVFSHGHTQINIAIVEEFGPRPEEDILIAAARRARRKEKIAGLRGILSENVLWFIGHTNLLYIDKEYKIVHCGHVSCESKIRGCGPITRSMYIPEKNRGFVLIDTDAGTVSLIAYPSFKVVDKISLVSS